MAIPSTSVVAVITSVDDSLSDASRLIPRPLASDASDSRYSHSERDGLISRRDKTMSHLQQDDQSIQSDDKKHKNADFEEESKAYCFELEGDLSSKTYDAGYELEVLEDEDVCPICLEEYNPENPKIETKCSHHYHLSCMYEWMERSHSCPICGKDMEFRETP